LGLKHLHTFVIHNYDISKYVYEIASHQQTWYFFCASGINFTGKIIHLIEVRIYITLQSHAIDDVLHTFKGDIYKLTNVLYAVLYSNFNKQWVEKNIVDFMKFNHMLEEFIKKDAVRLIRDEIKSGFY
jgi:hypothetical protein